MLRPKLANKPRRRAHHLLRCEPLEERRLLAADFHPRTLLQTPLDTSDPRIGTDSSPSALPLFDLAQVFSLQSKPDSKFTIYLDFNGHTTIGTSWNDYFAIDTIVSPPFTLDGDTNNFSQQELGRIVSSWQRTAEDFAPFDINVTTRDPGLDALTKSSQSDTTWGVRAVVSVDNFASCGCGGFAFLESFSDSVDTPAFIFNLGDGSLGETFSHEVGHTLSLVHDGTDAGGLEYYRGHGTGTLGWGAIMGAPFDQNVTQWDHGEYYDANNTTEDDLLAITTLNGFSYRVDDAGNTRASAKSLQVANSAQVNAFGIIERNTDIDYYVFETGAGNVSLDISTLGTRPNLDVWAGLYNSAGSLVAQSNPLNSLSASFTNLPLTAGTYYLRVEGIGNRDTYNAGTDSLVAPAAPVPWSIPSPQGYSGYGSLGQYAIQGTIVAPGTNAFHIVATDAVKSEGITGQQAFTFTISRTGNTSSAGSVTYALTPALPVLVGDNYPSIATSTDFAAGTPLGGTLAFVANEVSKTLTFQVLGDTLAELDESFDVLLSIPTSGWKLADSKATGIILSDEISVGIPTIGSSVQANEGPFDGALVRFRQIGAANGAFDEWGLDNVTLSNSTLADDFDPDIDFSNWNEISNATARTGFTGGTGKALFVSGGSDRRVVTRVLHAQPGDVLAFDLIFGNSANGGENADPGEDVVLEYSLDDGSSWNEIAVYDTEDYTSWTRLQAALPTPINTNPATQLVFTVARDGGIGLPVTVDWTVGVAGLTNPASPSDFAGGIFPSGQVQLAAGESTTQILVPILGDLRYELDEQFTVTLTAANGAGTVTLDPLLLTASGTILNDDLGFLINPGAQYRLRQLSFSSGEFDQWGIDNIGIPGTSFADDFDPTIDNTMWSEVQGGIVNANFGGTGHSLFFTGTDSSRSITSERMKAHAGDNFAFDLIYGSDVNGGENPEPGEEVTLEYSINDGATWTAIQTYPLPNFIWTRKQEQIPVAATVPATSQSEGNSGATPFSFLVERIGTASSVSWSVVGSGDHPAAASDFVGGVLPSGMVSFANGETRKSVTIQIAGDTTFESNETFDFLLGTGASQLAETATIVNDELTPSGDFNHDGLFTCLDIDQLVAQIAGHTGNLSFDLNGDGQLSLSDVDAWLAVAGTANIPSGNPYRKGDANLDGSVDGSDFGIWNSHKFTSNAGWCGGDFNADGTTDGSDFGIWNSNKFTSSLARPGTELSSFARAMPLNETYQGHTELIGAGRAHFAPFKAREFSTGSQQRAMRPRPLLVDRVLADLLR